MTYKLDSAIAGTKITAAPLSPVKPVGYEPNDFGSRTPVVQDDPEWRGFSIPETLRLTPL